MKTIFTKLSITCMTVLSMQTLMAQADLVPGMNFSYNPPGADGIITGIEVDACNNEATSVSSFSVGMFLYDPNTTNYWVIGTTPISSLSGNACVSITAWNIDINNTSGIPSGTYRLGVWVDSNEEITELDENNNSGLLSGSFSYSPSAVGLQLNHSNTLELSDAWPNPAHNVSNISFQTNSVGIISLVIKDMSGKTLQSLENGKLPIGKHEYKTDISSFEPGVYFYELMINNQKCVKKLVVL